MLTLNTYSALPTKLDRSNNMRSGLHRLFAAAVVNDQFRETLLNKPDEALTHGYLGQSFSLTDQEREIIHSIRADTLTDLAQKVNRALKST